MSPNHSNRQVVEKWKRNRRLKLKTPVLEWNSPGRKRKSLKMPGIPLNIAFPKVILDSTITQRASPSILKLCALETNNPFLRTESMCTLIDQPSRKKTMKDRGQIMFSENRHQFTFQQAVDLAASIMTWRYITCLMAITI